MRRAVKTALQPFRCSIAEARSSGTRMERARHLHQSIPAEHSEYFAAQTGSGHDRHELESYQQSWIDPAGRNGDSYHSREQIIPVPHSGAVGLETRSAD